MVDRRIDRSQILRFYREKQGISRLPLPFSIDFMTITNPSHALGDAILLTALPRCGQAHGKSIGIWSPLCNYFRLLAQFNPYFVENSSPFYVNADHLNIRFDTGNGHFIQRIERACGLEPELIPRGSVVVSGAPRMSNRVVIHLEPGPYANSQRLSVHPRARQIYPESYVVLQSFIDQAKLEFYEIGRNTAGLRGVENRCGFGMKETIELMNTCEYFIGIDSGPMHLAAALGLKIVTIVNFPIPSDICLPILKPVHPVLYRDLTRDHPKVLMANEVTGEIVDWLYPQSVLLHQDGEGGPQVKKLSVRNLNCALAGELYPYWSNEYLDLIFDKV